MDTTIERNPTTQSAIEIYEDVYNQPFQGESSTELANPSNPIELIETKTGIASDTINMMLELEEARENSEADFPASAFNHSDLAEIIKLGLSFDNKAITEAIHKTMSSNVLSACVQDLLTLIADELSSRFKERSKKIKANFTAKFLNDIQELHPDIDTTRIKDWVDLTMNNNMQGFDLSFNNGSSDFDAPNSDYAALTLSSDFTHIFQIDLDRRYAETPLINVTNELAIKTLHAPQQDFISYYTPLEEFAHEFRDVTINTCRDFYDHPKIIRRGMLETGMIEEDDSDEAIIEMFFDNFADLLMVEFSLKKEYTEGKKVSQFFKERIKDIHGISTYIHTRPTHVLVTHPDMIMDQIHNLGLDSEEGETSYEIKIEHAEEMLDNVYENALLIFALEAYVLYSEPLTNFQNLGFTHLNEVTPLEII